MAEMRRELLLTMVVGVVGVVSCRTVSQPPAHSDTEKPAWQTAVSLAGAAYRLTPENTKIEFVGSAGSKSQPGSFKQFSGGLDWPARIPIPTRLAIEIDMTSVSTNILPLTMHLKSADFFDVATYPRASFQTSKIEPGQTPGSCILLGDFIMHGVTKQLSIPATLVVAGKVLTLHSQFTIRQSEFGMVKAAKKTNDEVPITVSAKVTRS